MKRLAGALVMIAACGTSGAPGEGDGDRNLPSAGVGPFRALDGEEVKGVAPFVLDDEPARYREPAVLSDGDATVLFAESRGMIVRTHASDARTFFGTPATALVPGESWEGGALGGPFALRVGAEVFLYYASAPGAGSGIGLARATDGRTFQKVPGPLLTGATSPSVYRLPDGRFRMLYVAAGAIQEAESADGVVWSPLGGPPLLLGTDPCASAQVTPAGRFLVRVLYTRPEGGIALAAREGDRGPFEPNPTPVYAPVPAHDEGGAALLELGARSFLYVHATRRELDRTWAAIGAAITLETNKLPPPSDFPSGP